MKFALIIISIGIILSIIIFFPVTISEPYNTIEIYEENYTVIEPREMKVADWIKENVTVNQSFSDIRYSQNDLKHEISLQVCSDALSYGVMDLAYPGWGKINTISYEDGIYFAGYRKGFFDKRKDINTFNKSSNEGHIYRILKNEKVNMTLKQGEYLPLELGYVFQVNKIDDKLKSTKTTCDSAYEENNEDSTTCTTVTDYFQGASISLSDMNILEKWDVKNNSTLTYQKTLSGGETVPMIAVHVKEIMNSTVNIDAIFQLSEDHVTVPGGLGAEVAVNMRNIDTQPGTFNVYTGFVLNSSLGFEIGTLNQVFLYPSESITLFYTTDKDIETCRYYSQSISKSSIPENFTNFRDVNLSKRRTEYRNVTLYVDVVKTRLVERNVTKFKNTTVYGLFRIFQK